MLFLLFAGAFTNLYGAVLRQMKKIFLFNLFSFLIFLATPGLARASAPDPIRVGIFPFEPVNFITDKGVARGLNCDLLREISKINTGPQLEFVAVTWAEGLQKLQTEELDLMVSAARTVDREQVLDFNRSAVAEIWGQVYIRHTEHLDKITELEGKRIGVMRRDISARNFALLANTFSVDCEIIEYPTHDAVFEAVAAAEVDAGVAAHHFGVQHAKAHNLTGTPVQFSPFPIFFAAKKGLHQTLLTEIDTQLIKWRQDKDSFYYSRLDYWLEG